VVGPRRRLRHVAVMRTPDNKDGTPVVGSKPWRVTCGTMRRLESGAASQIRPRRSGDAEENRESAQSAIRS
jgi:hypothetical protein